MVVVYQTGILKLKGTTEAINDIPVNKTWELPFNIIIHDYETDLSSVSGLERFFLT